VRRISIWARLLGVAGTVLGKVELTDEQELVVSVRADRRHRGRCGVCGRRCPGYDAGDGRRRWRALDLGSTLTYLEADAPRVSCPRDGVVVVQVPWADHGARFTRSFDDQVAWLAVECSQTAVSELMRIAWRSVGSVLTRVSRRLEQGQDRLAGLQRIGIDEISWRRGQRYLIVVVDHDTSRLVWAAPGRDEATLERFFEQLGEERCKQITYVSADAASWISNVVQRRCPNAVRCLDAYHTVAWATEALDEVRRAVWNEARRANRREQAVALKGARWALWKNGDNLSPSQRSKLAWVQRVNKPLYQAYLIKEHLRLIFQLPFDDAVDLLIEWLQWAFDSPLEPIVRLACRIADHLDELLNTLRHNLSNARVEGLNTRIRLIARRAFGFHSAEALIALAMLALGAFQPSLPDRQAAAIG
jgi:transposase